MRVTGAGGAGGAGASGLLRAGGGDRAEARGWWRAGGLGAQAAARERCGERVGGACTTSDLTSARCSYSPGARASKRRRLAASPEKSRRPSPSSSAKMAARGSASSAGARKTTQWHSVPPTCSQPADQPPPPSPTSALSSSISPSSLAETRGVSRRSASGSAKMPSAPDGITAASGGGLGFGQRHVGRGILRPADGRRRLRRET